MNKNNQARTGNLKDPEKDRAKMKAETIIPDMPEVKDISGQENIIPPRMREIEDITISSADEEGAGLPGDLNKEGNDAIASDSSSNVSASEKNLLKKSAEQPPREDLDIPGA